MFENIIIVCYLRLHVRLVVSLKVVRPVVRYEIEAALVFGDHFHLARQQVQLGWGLHFLQTMKSIHFFQFRVPYVCYKSADTYVGVRYIHEAFANFAAPLLPYSSHLAVGLLHQVAHFGISMLFVAS